ncbi:hypothetical protein J6590_006125 [Homalodisca vitripennis]|nr:hypothetical protein J6590_006125 [Homalodisca vitripennis]
MFLPLLTFYVSSRAAQKLNLSSSPSRRKRSDDESSSSSGFCGAIHRSPPAPPPALLRRIGVKEVTGVGKAIMYRLKAIDSSNHCLPAAEYSDIETFRSNLIFSIIVKEDKTDRHHEHVSNGGEITQYAPTRLNTPATPNSVENMSCWRAKQQKRYKVRTQLQADRLTLPPPAMPAITRLPTLISSKLPFNHPLYSGKAFSPNHTCEERLISPREQPS